MLNHDRIDHNIFIANLGVPTIFHSRKDWGLVWLPLFFLESVSRPYTDSDTMIDPYEIHGNFCKCRNPIRIVRSIRKESPGLQLVGKFSSNNIRLNPQDFGKQKRVTHTHTHNYTWMSCWYLVIGLFHPHISRLCISPKKTR